MPEPPTCPPAAPDARTQPRGATTVQPSGWFAAAVDRGGAAPSETDSPLSDTGNEPYIVPGDTDNAPYIPGARRSAPLTADFVSKMKHGGGGRGRR